jgi:hypothetical protein
MVTRGYDFPNTDTLVEEQPGILGAQLWDTEEQLAILKGTVA